MDKNKQIEKIINFLELNGWKKQLIKDEYEEYISFTHANNYGIDLGIEDGEIVVIADIGDIIHISLSYYSIYALIGYLTLYPCDGENKIYKIK